MFLFTFTILESEKLIIWPVPAVVLGVMAPKRAYSTPFGPWPGPAECLWNCPSELRQFSSCCLPLPKLSRPGPLSLLFGVLWRRSLHCFKCPGDVKQAWEKQSSA